VLVVCVLAALGAAPGAGAHAYVRSTSPADGAVLKQSPKAISARYDEPVSTSAGALGVYDASGKQVDLGRLSRPAGNAVAVAIDRPLPDGTYMVTWRVTSADTHVVTGAWVFSVGKRDAVSPSLAAKLRSQGAVPARISFPFAVVRFLSFALLLGCAGGAAALLLVLRSAPASTQRRLAGVLVALASGLAVCAFAGIALEGAAGGGFGIRTALGSNVLSQVLSTRFGEVWRWRAWLALAFALVALSLERGWGGPARIRRGAIALLGLALVPTTSAAAHADVNGAATFAVDAAHVAAAAMWAGGLAFVALALVLTPATERWTLAARAVPRFSTLALGAFGVLAATGAANAALEVQSWQGLWDTSYGRLVLAKSALLLPLLALGAFNNRVSVPRMRAAVASVADRRRFLRAAAAELVLIAVVIGVTAALVGEPRPKDRPPRQSRSASVFRATSSVGPFRLELAVSPAGAGKNDIDVQLATRSGTPASVADVRVAAALRDRGIAPLRFEARRLGRGHFAVADAQLAIAGRWLLTFTVRQGQFSEWLQTIEVPIEKGG
jgi:copper transport protein